jgi:hypothetical protein
MPDAGVADIAVGVGVAAVADQRQRGVPALGAVGAEAEPGGSDCLNGEGGAGIEGVVVQDQPDLDRGVQAAG